MRNIYSAGITLVLLATAAVSYSQTPASSATKSDTTAAAVSRPIAITGARLLTITHGTIENGVLVMTGGKISAVGPARSTIVPGDAQIIDGKGMTVYPGLIDSETNLGLTEIESDSNSNDLSEPSDEIMAHMHVYDAFHAETERIPIVRYNGVTNAIVAPAADDTMAGQDIFIQLAGRDRDEMILVSDLALAMNFSGDQRRLSGGFDKAKYPMTRMGMASQLRQACLDAQDYSARQLDYDRKEAEWKKGDHKAAEPTFKRDLKLEGLLPYLSGAKPVVLGTYESHDVETAMSLAREFHLKVILNHVTHTQDILDKIASYHVPVIVGPIYDAPLANQRYDAVFSLPAELVKRGVKIAMASYRVQDNRNLPYAAGYAVAYGLPYDEAMKAITLNPAEIWGVADQLGSLDVGKTANVVMANGDPLDVRTDVKQVFMGGKAMPMVNRQTRLRDEYSK